MKLTKSSLEKKISTATNSSHHILVFITSEVTVISWKPQEVDWSFKETSSAKELCVTGTNYLTTWSTPVQSTRSRIAWTESGATTVRAELLARQPQVQVQVQVETNSAENKGPSGLQSGQQDRQRSDSIGRTVLQTVTQKLYQHVCSMQYFITSTSF